MEQLFHKIIDIKTLVEKPALIDIKDKFEFGAHWEIYSIDSVIRIILHIGIRRNISDNIRQKIRTL